MGSIVDPAAAEDQSLRFDEQERLHWLPPRDVPEGYDGLRLVAKVDGSDRIGHHVYDPSGAASTIRTDGDGPGLATGLYIFDGVCRRLNSHEASRTHSIPETTYSVMESFVNDHVTDERQREKEMFRFIGNSIPAMTLHDVARHLLSLLNW